MSSVKLSEKPTIHEGAKVFESTLGAWTEIGPNSVIEESAIGDYTYTAGDAQITYSEIGKYCSIASHVRIHPVNHPMWRVTQHHMTYRKVQYDLGDQDDMEFFEWRKDHKVTVGHDVWIGHGAIIMPGVSIGTGAVIGSGAVVTKDVPPYMIAVGVPAKPIKERFPKEIAEKLLEIAWWEWDRATLEERFEELNDVRQFVDKYGK
ncbi:DapH/DapD/GlmU-related protein [Bacillus sp. UMB0893]|uniref:DapH/DapD/GlmU-related protein n=1 Tax=Bacillus sp. UMB0893 TaxID=2066053 RepID=UPI000C765877|nr:DapH/DapD/GlmU-related protein [Bacillus sp. UMB0893]PLR69193.1 acetyltransferase [Bacillus sp. UMB0893]